ncbi:hypothetical protein D3C72_1251670 [compost metagenome]
MQVRAVGFIVEPHVIEVDVEHPSATRAARAGAGRRLASRGLPAAAQHGLLDAAHEGDDGAVHGRRNQARTDAYVAADDVFFGAAAVVRGNADHQAVAQLEGGEVGKQDCEQQVMEFEAVFLREAV